MARTGRTQYNCDGSVDEGFDADGDGYRTCDGDCDDSNVSVNPGAAETCDGLDNNCDGIVDEGFISSVWYADADGDGYGNAASSTTACARPLGYVADETDCDDTNSDINPAMTKLCDGLDNNCDGQVDKTFVGTVWYADADGDGYGDKDSSQVACA